MTGKEIFMATPLSNNHNNNNLPIGANKLYANKQVKAGHIVLNPPEIKPYTFYDKIKVDHKFYKELVDPHSKAFFDTKNQTKNKLKSAIKFSVILLGATLGFIYRKNIQKFLLDTTVQIKNILKK